MAVFLSIDNGAIKGEAQDSQFPDTIEVITFNHHFFQAKSATAGSAGGSTAAKGQSDDIYIKKYVDLATPSLAAACLGGKTFGEAVITFIRADAANANSSKAIPYLVLRIKNVLIASVTANLEDEGQLLTETIGLRGTALDWKYSRQGISGGQSGNSQGSFSLAKNINSYA